MENKIAVIGLGIMGGAMANNLLSKGFDVNGYDVSGNARAEFAACGGRTLESPEAAIEGTSLVLTSLPTADALREVVAALAPHAVEDRILIDVSTLSLPDKRAARMGLEAVNCTMLDCPVSGTGTQAVSGDLTVFASGDAESFERAKRALNAIAREVLYVGEFGSGSTLKFIANHLVTIHNAAAAEALILAKKAGLDMQMVYGALKDSAAMSRMFQVRGPMIVNGTFNPAMRISAYQKDLDIIGSFAGELRCPTPLFNVCAQLYLSAQSQGHGDLDTAAIAKVIEALAGLRVDEFRS